LPHLLVSFLKFSGWRLLRDDIHRFLDRLLGATRKQIMPALPILAMEAPHTRVRPDHV
jgi:hypothetical protein